MYLLCKLDLDTSTNVVKYVYPEWMTDSIKGKMVNLSNTTPADTFVDVVIETDDQQEIDLIISNGGKELTIDQFNSWKEAKELALSLLEENTDEPTI